MKVLQVNCVYKKGSTGSIVFSIHSGLKQNGYGSVVCYGRGSDVSEKDVYKISSEIEAKIHALYARISGIQYSSSFFATNRLINIIKKEKPDIVHLHCINGYFVNIYRILDYLKMHNIYTVLTLHAEFMYTGNCGHSYDCEKWLTGCGNCPQLWKATKSIFLDRTSYAWQKMAEAFNGFNNLSVVSVSSWLSERAKKSPMLKDKENIVIENGIDTEDVFHSTNVSKLRKKYNIKDEKVILHVTASFSDKPDNAKGGHFIIKLAKRLINENIKFFVIGSYNKSIDLPENIINVGRVDDRSELADFYSIADLTVITSKRETFSLPCAESMACGTPVVGFKAGGPETIALKDFSEFVEYGDLKKLLKAILDWINKKRNMAIELETAAGNRYSNTVMAFKYLGLYNSIKYPHNGGVID